VFCRAKYDRPLSAHSRRMRGETELSEADIGPGSLSSMLHGSYCLRGSRIFDDVRSRSEWTVISPPCARVISNGIVRLDCTSKLRCITRLADAERSSSRPSTLCTGGCDGKI
jgi:hypothetical protein